MTELNIPAVPQEESMAADIADAPLDIRDMKLDLSREERVRTVCLMMATRYHVETIIKDPRYLELMIQREKEAKFSNDPDEQARWHLTPTTAGKVIDVARMFEDYLTGKPSPIAYLKIGDEEIEAGAGRAAQDSVQEG